MKDKIIFLDIDGVLNGHEFNAEAQSGNIRNECVQHLNRIIRLTGAKIVLSSAWRYIVHGKQMTLKGFAYMLRTHGFIGIGNLIGVTVADETCTSCGYSAKIGKGKYDENGQPKCKKCGAISLRASQVSTWLRQNHESDKRTIKYVVLDDDDLGFARAGLPFVQTNPRVGLTRVTANRAIKLLGVAANVPAEAKP